MGAVSHIPVQKYRLWDKVLHKRTLLSFELELTARCNLDCRHCYINLPAGDRTAKAAELSLKEISQIADQAIELGALSCLLTGGEPLLRRDFKEIYLMLKRKGLLISVFTNATLIRDEHVELFRTYPPRDMEITVYGASAETFERITRKPGSFKQFRRGLDNLLAAGVYVRLKAMALRSNLAEMPAIAVFARAHTRDFYRFDPQLHLRYDGNAERNREIMDERLTLQEFVALEKSDPERFGIMEKMCTTKIRPRTGDSASIYLIGCGAGLYGCTIGYEGTFRLCASLMAPGTTANVRETTLRDAWENHVPRVRGLQVKDREFAQKCMPCPLIDLCMACPANIHLETGHMDRVVDYYCRLAHARARAFGVSPELTRSADSEKSGE